MMQKKSDFKLPQIKKAHKESSVLLSKTITDNACTPKLRPASSSKVQDLQKKLFNKIQDYEIGSKKKMLKKSSKNNKQTINDQFAKTESNLKYEQMQKCIMPGLYSKLVEVKKGNYMSQQLIGSMQSTIQPKQQHANTKRESKQASSQQLQSKIQTPFITDSEVDLLSQQEMEKIFKDYSLLEGLGPTTSIKDMKQMNDSLLYSEKDIDDLKKSMEGLIKSVGMEYLRQIENDQESRFLE